MFVLLKCRTVQELTELLEYDYGKVRAYLGTQCTPGALFLTGYLGGCVPLIVYPVTQHYQLSWAGNGAQSTSLAPCLFNLDPCHIWVPLI